MTTRKKLLPAIATLALTSCSMSMAQTNSILWYNTPAKAGMAEALPVGNGRIGALVYGGETERIVLNDSSLWTGDQNPSGDYATMGSYQMLGELVLTPTTSKPTLSAPIKTPRISSPSGQKPYFANQEVAYASDGNPDTKWCIEHGNKPVTWQVEMPARSAAATWYAFTSAEDVPERDPSTWELTGSMDGQAWNVLDKHENHPPSPSAARRRGTASRTQPLTTFIGSASNPNRASRTFSSPRLRCKDCLPCPQMVMVPLPFQKAFSANSISPQQ